MNLSFERGDAGAPAGHALIYFRVEGGVTATYVTVSPIKFDLTSYVPGFLVNAMQGMDLGDATVVTLPPIPERVPGVEWLEALAERRRDDLVYAGMVTASNPMTLAGETAEAARAYADLCSGMTADVPVEPAPPPETVSRFVGMPEGEQLSQLTGLTGRLLDSLRSGSADADVEAQMRELAAAMPAKYRVSALISAVHEPGDRGRRLADLYIQRCYKLFNEEYLDLERIDREIEAAHG